jgi:aerobic-type carbon monoxide dehydrogenase small subunit (CoxS/CutS family)
MPNEVDNKCEGGGLNRRNFLKSAGVAVAGGTLAAGMKFTPEAAAADPFVPTTVTNFRCPIDGRDFATFGELRSHFSEAHPGAVLPVTTTLQRTLQFKLGLTGAKQMCDRGVCGSCSVIIDGRVVLSCTTLAVECEGKSIETVEGIAANPKWHQLIQSYCKWDAMQCGYCTPGFVVSAKALLDRNPNPTEDDCKQALAGNICCCGTYPRHPTAIMEAAQLMKGGV